MACIKATKCCHLASTHSDITQCWLFWTFHCEKELQLTILASNNNMGMTHQTDEKNLHNVVEYSVGVVKLAHYCYITHFL